MFFLRLRQTNLVATSLCDAFAPDERGHGWISQGLCVETPHRSVVLSPVKNNSLYLQHCNRGPAHQSLWSGLLVPQVDGPFIHHRAAVGHKAFSGNMLQVRHEHRYVGQLALLAGGPRFSHLDHGKDPQKW